MITYVRWTEDASKPQWVRTDSGEAFDLVDWTRTSREEAEILSHPKYGVPLKQRPSPSAA